MSGDPDTTPPLPRFRYHHATGQWRKEAVKGLTAADVAERAARLKAGVVVRSQVAPGSSFDYFLRKSYAVEKSRNSAVREAKQREHTIAHMETFQRSHLVAAQQTHINSSDRDVENSGRSATTDTDAPVSAIDTNPVMGFLMGVPLSAVYTAIVDIKGPIFPQSLLQSLVNLDFAEFVHLLQTVRPEVRISEAYMYSMFSTLPCHNKVFDTLPAFDFYTYVLGNTYHPHLDGNTEMLFHAFDPEDRGFIPIESLNARVIAAYAELHTFGNLRENWLQLSNAFAEEEEEGGLPRDVPKLIDPMVTKAILAASPRLYEVVNTIDMEGGGHMGKRIFCRD